MKIIKKPHESFELQDAHGGSGKRHLLVGNNEIPNVQGMTHGFLPAQTKFPPHCHKNLNEVMFVLKGQGFVSDDDATYPYTAGDMFIFPCGVTHEITNTAYEQNEYVFVRVYEKTIK